MRSRRTTGNARTATHGTTYVDAAHSSLIHFRLLSVGKLICTHVRNFLVRVCLQNYEKVDGEKEQLYKCATCDQTRPGFTDIRKQKEAEAAAKKPASLFAGGAISFGGEETTASDDAAASAGDLFGLGGGGAKAPASAPGLDLFGTGASSPAPAAGGLDLFGTASATTSAPALNLFGTPAPAPAAAEVFTTLRVATVPGSILTIALALCCVGFQLPQTEGQ